MSARQKAKPTTKSTKPTKPAPQLDIRNRRAFHEFELSDRYMAGIALVGTEVKSIRAGHAQISESFVKIDKAGEAYLYGMTISPYSHGNINNHDPNRTRKLLLTKTEIQRIRARIDREKLTVVVLKVFLRHGYVKLEIALAKRKQLHDKRRTLKEKAITQDMKRMMKGQG